MGVKHEVWNITENVKHDTGNDLSPKIYNVENKCSDLHKVNHEISISNSDDCNKNENQLLEP